jgi:hypothetical protein
MDVVPKEVVHYLEFADKLVFELEEQDVLNIQTQKYIRMMNMRAQVLMEDHAKNLKFHKEKNSRLVLVLDTLSGDLKVVVDQQKKVHSKRTLVEAFQTFADEGIVNYLL